MGKDDKNDFKSIHNKIVKLRPDFIKSVVLAINKSVGSKGTLNDYKIVWNQLQEIATQEIEKILKKEFPGCVITIPPSKSTYPDIKMEFNGFKIAIDIKSNESSKDPWYDIARLDSVKEERLNKYDEEYDLVVKYDSETKKLIKIFFEPMRDTVGIREECNGVKYRPYDGKIRPKSWTDFDSGKTYWPTKEKFLEGIEKSRKHGMKELIKEHAKSLTKEEKEELKKSFDN